MNLYVGPGWCGEREHHPPHDTCRGYGAGYRAAEVADGLPNVIPGKGNETRVGSVHPLVAAALDDALSPWHHERPWSPLELDDIRRNWAEHPERFCYMAGRWLATLDLVDPGADIDGRVPNVVEGSAGWDEHPSADDNAKAAARVILGRGLPVDWSALSLRQVAEAALTDFIYEHGSDFTPELWPGMSALRHVLGADDTERAVGTGICCDAPLENGWTCTRLPNHEGVHQ